MEVTENVAVVGEQGSAIGCANPLGSTGTSQFSLVAAPAPAPAKSLVVAAVVVVTAAVLS